MLFDDWEKVIRKNNPALAGLFTADGFFPGYFSASPKVLFMGRESRFTPTRDRVADDLAWFKSLAKGEGLGAYWNRIISLVNGIQNFGRLSYSALPAPAIILAEMVKNNSYGFAIMNISKYVNPEEEKSGTSNFNLINQFLADSALDKRNFIQEEIALLEPDIIITANLWDCGIKKTYLNKLFPQSLLGPVCFDDNKNASLKDFHLNGRTIKLIDVYHFSAAGSTQDKFYDPVMELLFKLY